jgi:5-(carboxyamino)imidazole ribonucleotide mutase
MKRHDFRPVDSKSTSESRGSEQRAERLGEVTADVAPLVGIVMGSRSDWETMRHTADVLVEFGVDHDVRVVSAHRTPGLLATYAEWAEATTVEVIIAGAGGAAHLPGMLAAHTVVPVLGVPVRSAALSGMDSLLSIVQMPRGIPVGTLAIGPAGAANAGLLAVAMLSASRPALRSSLRAWRASQTAAVLAGSDPRLPEPGAHG